MTLFCGGKEAYQGLKVNGNALSKIVNFSQQDDKPRSGANNLKNLLIGMIPSNHATMILDIFSLIMLAVNAARTAQLFLMIGMMLIILSFTRQ